MSNEEEAEIRGDVLESILSHLPLINLLLPTYVSKSWNHAVFSSLRHFNSPKPWLIVHSQNSRPPYSAVVAVAYDPRSDIWVRLDTQNPPFDYASVLRSSNSTLLYVLSLSKFSFSFDPLHLTWHHVDPPLVWRTDPIVAMVGRRVIVAGGACDFEDDPLSVEIYDVDARRWDTCESMPATLRDSAASTWLSVAASSKTLFVMEQGTGSTYSFDPISRIWSGPFDLRHDRSIFFSVIGISGDKLTMVGLLGNSENVGEIKVWELNGESFDVCKEIAVMPKELVEKLKGEHASLNSIKICSMGDFLYIYNPQEPEELVMYEIFGQGICRWGSLKNAAVNDRSRVAEKMVLTCADVGLGDLGKAVGSGNVLFSIVNGGILQ
ncbi:Kelch domain-containing F-box protein [Hibiscus trionum]|uniref:Kelch domain-containing F-box protein n=1 Tax=Hibiscus trionum TaxID=183268 RepID=A0A9W7LRU5_HIBTR|nr:Kelch domain-containing F-box protein [Hibiscus trionum]